MSIIIISHTVPLIAFFEEIYIKLLTITYLWYKKNELSKYSKLSSK